jgi:hypothetical protein
MAAPVTRVSPVYWNDKKIGYLQKVKYDQNANVTQEQTLDAIVLAIGRGTTAFALDILSPIGGIGITVNPQEQGKLKILSEGKLHVVEVVMTSKSHDSEAANGRTMASWSFVGGEPQIT